MAICMATVVIIIIFILELSIDLQVGGCQDPFNKSRSLMCMWGGGIGFKVSGLGGVDLRGGVRADRLHFSVLFRAISNGNANTLARLSFERKRPTTWRPSIGGA